MSRGAGEGGQGVRQVSRGKNAVSYNIAEAAEMLGISKRTVRRRIQKGELPADLEEGPYGPEYRIPAEAITTAQEIVDVVRVERPTDPQTLAMIVVRALEERDRCLQEEITELRREVTELTQALENYRKAVEAPKKRWRWPWERPSD
jgi:excisionase family DNA binding protein